MFYLPDILFTYLVWLHGISNQTNRGYPALFAGLIVPLKFYVTQILFSKKFYSVFFIRFFIRFYPPNSLNLDTPYM